MSLKNQMEVFKANLIHDITPSQFADVYAQTIAYGMFAARLHDKTLENFSRQEAVFLIPKTNPFLRGLFSYISGAECDDRLIWIIDSLAEIFLATDLAKILSGFGQKTGQDDPIIHFYETFLGEYNPALRKARGVWYTPEAVVSFIVRACDEVLKDEFGIEDGLTDDTKIKIKTESETVLYTKDGKTKLKDQTIEKEVHKVQILDPATGTGTFLAETIKFIKKDFFGSWSSYVEEHLIPRLNGFELLMASYAMAHLKLDLLLIETGYKPINQKRFNIFLTNSLEEATLTQNNLFQWYARESLEASRVKKETPVMVVMGNPPYSGESSNSNDFINKLMDDYKKEWDGSKLKEKNSKWLNDDYAKFIRYSESYIQKNDEGILGFITNHGYLDNPTFRGMRYHLLNTFDKIYIIDLHGNSKKQEVCPDGSKDENVFDIMQGVSIIIGIKKKTKTKKLAELFIFDMYGKRDLKYKSLNENSLKSLPFEKVDYKEPQFYFVKKDLKLQVEYENSFIVNNLFKINSAGIVTARDHFTIQFSENTVKHIINDFSTLDVEEARLKYNLGKDVRDWKVEFAQKDLLNSNINEENIMSISYRVFDNRKTYFTGNSKGFHCMPRGNVMRNFIKNNIGLIFNRETKKGAYSSLFITNTITDSHIVDNISYIAPLYIYPDENSLETERTPNLNLEIVADIEKALNLKFTPEKEDDKNTFAPIDILDYIYAVLHSPNYREKYKEFLKIDFPRVPYPDPETFWQLVALGSELRALHLMESDTLNDRVIDTDGEGEMIITNKLNKKDATIENDLVTLKLNADIAIINIPLVAWEFFIGGYQPAQKWLKDRVGRELSRTDLKHYNKIINALIKTDEIMKKIDEI